MALATTALGRGTFGVLGATCLFGFAFFGGGVALLVGGASCGGAIGGFGFALLGGGVALSIAWTARNGAILAGLTQPELLIARAAGFAIFVGLTDLRITQVVSAFEIGFTSRWTGRARAPSQGAGVVDAMLLARAVFVALAGGACADFAGLCDQIAVMVGLVFAVYIRSAFACGFGDILSIGDGFCGGFGVFGSTQIGEVASIGYRAVIVAQTSDTPLSGGVADFGLFAVLVRGAFALGSRVGAAKSIHTRFAW